MKVFHTIYEIQKEIAKLKAKKLSIGFVPTMGALHQGHLSLLNEAAKQTDIQVVSIFVNPTQFNDKSDFKNYPRNLQSDVDILAQQQCAMVFSPTEKEMYPTPDTRVFNFDGMDAVMEGLHRPGHFNGVAQIVSRLFDAVMPDKAFFGQKDFQQVAIIKKMVQKHNYPIEIVTCPTLREKDGLAMSSRNKLLNKEMRRAAPLIYNSLFDAKEKIPQYTVNEIKQWVINSINKSPHLKVEYFEIVDETSLQPIQHWDESLSIRGCVAVYAGAVRLIDNIRLNS